jgi:hypothetical protein
MRVEFFGPPGVGKSYARRLLLEADSRLDLHTACGSVKVLKDHTEFYNSCVVAQRMYQEHCVVPKRGATGPANFRMRAARAAAAAVSNNIIVFDESLLQATLSFSYACRHNAENVAEFFSSVPLPDVAILCYAPSELVVARNSGRARNWGSSALDCLPSVELIKNMLTERNGVWFTLNTQKNEREITLHLIEGLKCFL